MVLCGFHPKISFFRSFFFLFLFLHVKYNLTRQKMSKHLMMWIHNVNGDVAELSSILKLIHTTELYSSLSNSVDSDIELFTVNE
jgi:hypothetical protein